MVDKGGVGKNIGGGLLLFLFWWVCENRMSLADLGKIVNLRHKTREVFMNENNIKEALRKGERVTLECKKAMAEVPKSLWETYSAFANTISGLILLGVE